MSSTIINIPSSSSGGGKSNTNNTNASSISRVHSHVDVFSLVASFLGDPKDLLNVALCCKLLFNVISERSDPVVSMEESIYGPACNGKKFDWVDLDSSSSDLNKFKIKMRGMCGLLLKKMALIDTTRLIGFIKQRQSINAIMIAHCFGINSSIFTCLGNMEFIAICDSKYEYRPPTATGTTTPSTTTTSSITEARSASIISTNLNIDNTIRFLKAKVVILSNTVFRNLHSFRKFLKEHLPTTSTGTASGCGQLKLLGLGGCHIEDQSAAIVPPASSESYAGEDEENVLSSDDFFVDVTFLSKDMKDAIKRYYPNSIAFNTSEDQIGTLEGIFKSCALPESFKYALICAKNLSSETSLHICRDVDRVEWLLNSMRADVERKDKHGNSCLQRYIIDNRADLVEKILSSLLIEDKYLCAVASEELLSSLPLNSLSSTTIPTPNPTATTAATTAINTTPSSQISSGHHQDLKTVRNISRILLMKTHWSDSTLYYSCLKGRREISKALIDAIPDLFKINVRDKESMKRVLQKYHNNSNILATSDCVGTETSHQQQDASASCASSSSALSASNSVAGTRSKKDAKATQPSSQDVSEHLMHYWKEICTLIGVNFSNTLAKRFKSALLKPSFSGTFQDVFFCDGQGFSPLHAAVIAKDRVTVELLLKAGFSIDFPNESLQTPRDIASRATLAGDHVIGHIMKIHDDSIKV